MAKIYYSINKQITYDSDGAGTLEGGKEVSVYRVINNDLDLLTTLDLDNSDNSEGEIMEFLDDEGFEDYQLILL